MTTRQEPIRHLYLHIPFCPAKCAYCAFVTHIGSPRLIEPYVQALISQIEAIGKQVGRQHLDTVYLGGGTPSMLSPGQIGRLLAAADGSIEVASDAEVTMEAHPDTVDSSALAGYRAAGVTRLSFGGESLDPAELRHIGRGHTPERVLEVVADAHVTGFDAVNVDLMYGLPGQSEASWHGTLERLIGAEPDHISLYPLSIEPKTVFSRLSRQGRLPLPPDGEVARMYQAACRVLRAAGYEHYEVANWALPGHRSRHNMAYWQNRQYFAAGVGAHGYVKPYRWENMRQTARYVEAIGEGKSVIAEREVITRDVELSETVMLRLRLLEDGLDLREIEREFGAGGRLAVEQAAREPLERGLLHRREDALLLREEAVPIANEVWQRFMLLEVDAAATVTP